MWQIGGRLTKGAPMSETPCFGPVWEMYQSPVKPTQSDVMDVLRNSWTSPSDFDRVKLAQWASLAEHQDVLFEYALSDAGQQTAHLAFTAIMANTSFWSNPKNYEPRLAWRRLVEKWPNWKNECLNELFSGASLIDCLLRAGVGNTNPQSSRTLIHLLLPAIWDAPEEFLKAPHPLCPSRSRLNVWFFLWMASASDQKRLEQAAKFLSLGADPNETLPSTRGEMSICTAVLAAAVKDQKAPYLFDGIDCFFGHQEWAIDLSKSSWVVFVPETKAVKKDEKTIDLPFENLWPALDLLKAFGAKLDEAKDLAPWHHLGLSLIATLNMKGGFASTDLEPFLDTLQDLGVRFDVVTPSGEGIVEALMAGFCEEGLFCPLRSLNQFEENVWLDQPGYSPIGRILEKAPVVFFKNYPKCARHLLRKALGHTLDHTLSQDNALEQGADKNNTQEPAPYEKVFFDYVEKTPQSELVKTAVKVALWYTSDPLSSVVVTEDLLLKAYQIVHSKDVLSCDLILAAQKICECLPGFLTTKSSPAQPAHWEVAHHEEEGEDEENTIKQSEKIEDVYFEIFTEENRASLLKWIASRQDIEVLKPWKTRFEKTSTSSEFISGTRRLAPAAPALAGMENLLAAFPHFEDVTQKLMDHLALAMTGDGAFFIPPLLMVGPPGTGKTFFFQQLARLVATHYHILNMESVTGGFSIVGLEANWSSGAPGALFDALIEGQTANPILLLDEVDKCSGSDRYGVENVLLSLLEPHSASQFKDRCVPIPLDARRVSFVATANDLSSVSLPLLSRFEVAHVTNPDFHARSTMAFYIYKALRAQNPWGEAFDDELPRDTIEALARPTGATRDLRKNLTSAFAAAARAGRRCILPKDIPHTPEAVRPFWDLALPDTRPAQSQDRRSGVSKNVSEHEETA